jgi:large subunit ribosomal protein L31
MKKDTHPTNFRDVLFYDNSSDTQFLIGSTVATTETGTFEGKEYPLYRVEISAASHPFYTGTEKVIDTAGRVDRFKKRAAAASSKK